MRGASTRQISQALYVTEDTIQKHLQNVFEKVGVRTRQALVKRLYLNTIFPYSPINAAIDVFVGGAASLLQYSSSGTCRPSSEKILPGFRMLCGSASLFISRMSGRESPCSLCRCFVLPKPIPCSPVQVPPRARA